MTESANPTSNRIVAIIKMVLRKLLTIYIVVIVLLGFLQRKLLYHPLSAKSLPVASSPDIVGLFPGAQDVEIEFTDKQFVRGWLLRKDVAKQPSQNRPLVIYMHGNAGNRSGRGPWYQVMDFVGADVLAIDYPGYGDSDGTINEGALEASCDAAWTYATQTLGYQPSQIVIGGTSLGGAAAVYLCAKTCEDGTPPAALFVVATFSSMVDVGSSLYWWLPVRAVLVDRFPSDQRAAKITCPVVVMHGDKDTLVKQDLGKKLFDAFPESSAGGIKKRWVNLSGIGHNDLMIEARLLGDEIKSLLQQSL